ncbi:hypothetical protein OKA05_11200 [Luteolibacter arcticus]|uniref:Uncharacterized protein n=1 Tax=Luteolibacter arcticus TaxID=1581411 RepID=A0ABT3GHY6_9BACT|nr:hypothetical protein [Luteolibacter arcticus]MCW1923120.1 hypothetical protein [Luteolibacter arcticus]
MLLYKLQLLTPGQSTRRAMSARLLAGAQPDAFVTRVRHRRLPDASEAPVRRFRKVA